MHCPHHGQVPMAGCKDAGDKIEQKRVDCIFNREMLHVECELVVGHNGLIPGVPSETLRHVARH